ncbi:hypothetical protein JCM3770_003702 [Rhodotorula araucariae]
MLKLTLIALAGVATVLADDGRLALTNNKVEQEAYSDLELKEVCYRNLYADLDDFDVKHSIETVVSDKKGQTVFLSDGIKRDFKDKEYYYEEFCYKKFKGREHDEDVEHAHGLLVGRQVDPSNAVLSSSFSDDVGDVAGSSADDVLAGGDSDSSAAVLRARQVDDVENSSRALGRTSSGASLSSADGGLEDGSSAANLDLGLAKRQGLTATAGLTGSSFSPADFITGFNNASNALGVNGVLQDGSRGKGLDGDQAKDQDEPVRHPIGTADTHRDLAPPVQEHADGGTPSEQQQATAAKAARVEGKKVDKRAPVPSPAPGYIVRVMRWMTVTWDGDEESDCGEGAADEALDNGPQTGIIFE